MAHLDLFQRTAQWIIPLDNPAYSTRRSRHGETTPPRSRTSHWKLSDLFAKFSNAVIDSESPEIHAIAQMCQANLEENVSDPELREKLRPDHGPAASGWWCPTSSTRRSRHPTPTSSPSGSSACEPEGVRTTDGELHELDVLVLATGFHTDAFMRPMEVVGRDGVTLEEAWADRPIAYLSVSIPDFPNFFMLNGPNGPVGNFSLIEVAERQFAYIEQLLELLSPARRRRSARPAMPRRRTSRRGCRRLANTIWVTGCNSWYLDERGVPAAWPWPFQKFRDVMERPDLSAFDLR